LYTKIGVIWIFWQFWAVRHISSKNCTEIARDRLGQTALPKFSAQKRSFQQPKAQPFRFKKACALGHQIWATPKKSSFYHCCSFSVKSIEDRHRLAACRNKLLTSFLEVSTLMTLNDHERSK